MKLQYTRLAHNDLISLFEYIVQDDTKAAQRVARSIRSGIERLIQFPSYGRPGDVDGTRQFLVPDAPYIVVYELRDEAITILRIYHTSQDRR